MVESWRRRTPLEKKQFWKAINGADQVFHQPLNLTIFCESLKEYFPSVNQKPVLAISGEIYIPANWHQLSSTDMLKHRVIFTVFEHRTSLPFPKHPLVHRGCQRLICADSWHLGGWKRLLHIFFKLIFQTYLRNQCEETGSKEFWTKRNQRIVLSGHLSGTKCFLKQSVKP